MRFFRHGRAVVRSCHRNCEDSTGSLKLDDGKLLQAVQILDAEFQLHAGLAYSYDQNKNRTAETDSILSDHSYTASYDNKDRLTAFDKSNYNQHDQTWTLSKEGDWNNTVFGGVSETRTHNDVHEMLTRGGNSLTTDAKGNITVNSNGQRYTWDADNMMSAADIRGDLTNDVTYVYDAGNRRIAKIANGITTVFAYAGWRCVEEYDATSTPVALRKFAFGAYLDEPLMMASVSGTAETLHFYHQNANYNVIALTDAAGSIADRIAYSSYGQIVMVTDGSTGNPWFFTGQRYDGDTGLDYYKKRYYDPNLGRFLSRDPFGDDFNLYEYVDSMSLINCDPFGLFKLSYVVNYKDGGVDQESMFKFEGPIEKLKRVDTPVLQGDGGSKAGAYVKPKIKYSSTIERMKVTCTGKEKNISAGKDDAVLEQAYCFKIRDVKLKLDYIDDKIYLPSWNRTDFLKAGLGERAIWGDFVNRIYEHELGHKETASDWIEAVNERVDILPDLTYSTCLDPRKESNRKKITEVINEDLNVFVDAQMKILENLYDSMQAEYHAKVGDATGVNLHYRDPWLQDVTDAMEPSDIAGKFPSGKSAKEKKAATKVKTKKT